MNMLERQEVIRQHCISRLEHQLTPYPDYPIERFIEVNGLETTVPVGPWDINNTNLPTTLEMQLLKSKMCQLDAVGRPIHPWFKDLVRTVGVVAGKGAYWNWGPNYTADPVVITQETTPNILLIQRNDNRKWALPGGFLDNIAESTTDACKRECLEETTYLLTVDPESIVYQGVVADERTTAHAWAYTTAKLFRPERTAPVKGNDDANSAAWFEVNKLPENLHGSHAKIIALALQDIQL